jgi:hypothetical protein
MNNNVTYVGLSRSGSHWIRLVLEHYMGGNSPLSNFLGSPINTNNFITTHDLQLDFVADYVIYLYRNPIDCIYSNLKYDGIDTNLDCISKIDYYLDIWIRHIQKWIYDENFTKDKVILCYEKLKNDFNNEFSKLLIFLNLQVNTEKIEEGNNIYTKSKIKKIVRDDRVINDELNYEIYRELFTQKYKNYIYDKLPINHRKLLNQ